MREIKFRVWDKEHKMFLPNEIYDIHSRTSFGSFGIMRKDWRNYSIGEYFYDNAQIIEQYTGLKDKNGTEIYDGDQIGDWNMVDGKKVQSKLQVFWNEAMAQWCVDLSADQDKSYCDALWTELRDFEYEIVGNIHQNPDLL